MIDIEAIFKFKQPDMNKLQDFGFLAVGDVLEYRRFIKDGQFYIAVTVSGGKTDYRVVDALTDEEYAPVKVAAAQGSFLAELRAACEQLLSEVAEKCFDTDVFKAEQTRRILHHMAEKYGCAPEYLWEKSPDSAVLRHKSNQKWFAVIMSVDKSKLDPKLHGLAEIIDLKASADWVSKAIDGVKYYKGYHMNKKYWYTVPLDGTLTDKEILERIDESYILTK